MTALILIHLLSRFGVRPVQRRLRLEPGQALSLPRQAGVLRVVGGEVWLTCERGAQRGVDHMLRCPQTMALGVADHAVVESARADRAARVVWEPRRRAHRGPAPALALQPSTE